jgi:hypothetical protein
MLFRGGASDEARWLSHTDIRAADSRRIVSRAVGTRLAIPLGDGFRAPAMRAKTTIVTFRTALDLADVGTIKPSL